MLDNMTRSRADTVPTCITAQLEASGGREPCVTVRQSLPAFDMHVGAT